MPRTTHAVMFAAPDSADPEIDAGPAPFAADPEHAASIAETHEA